jgi:glutamate dehydrogenase
MMSGKAEAKLSQLIDQVTRQVGKKTRSGKTADALVDFTRRLYKNVPPDDLRGISPENLAGAAHSLWKLMGQRQPGTAKVRVFNPRQDSDGWAVGHTVVEIVNDDKPFLVDSMTLGINNMGAEVHLVIHPVMLVKRASGGRLQGIVDETDAAGALHESIMHIQVNEQTDEDCEKIARHLEGVLDEIAASVEDWRSMRARCGELITELEDRPPLLPHAEVAEAIAFLKWMDDDHFTFLGYREYRFEGRGARAVSKIDPKSGLGLLRDPEIRVFKGLRNLGKLPADVRQFVRAPVLLRITKANKRSNVHRPVQMDTVAVKIFDQKGNVAGERLFTGLFTSVAYARSPREIPILREKAANVIRRSGFRAGSHDGKALLHILETYPRDELFEISENELHDIAMGVLHLQERQRTALFVRHDPFERFVSCMVYVPRERYDTNLRHKIEAILEQAYDGKVETFSTRLTDAALARVHFIIATHEESIPKVDTLKLEAGLVEAARSFVDHLEQALVAALGEIQGIKTLRRFERAFPASYQEAFDAKSAVADIACIEHAIKSGDLAMNLYRPAGAAAEILNFKIYVSGDPVPLSDILPMLENMGFRVIGEVPYKVAPTGHDEAIWIHDFDMDVVGEREVDLDVVREHFHDAFHRVWHRRMENDGFNKLVLGAGLTARQVIVLRAYAKYLRQARIPFSQRYMGETLAGNPTITRLLIDLFESRFDPARTAGSDKRTSALRNAILQELEDVANLDEDRIIRRYLNIIESTLRTNFYQTGDDGAEKDYCSFKLDSRNIDELPLPQPFREIFVYSPRIEGVHLRFGMVARGGLRWSDRREDFRTEILGLVKAQQVKNAVIVPVGSKGGFVVKDPPPAEAGRDAFLAEGIECYQTFIRGLLDITDNLRKSKLIPPTQVARYDGDDPYLVVAADKGTATFSDIANSVSIDYGHWLDDAFASGGSAGYDHKKMGITARGAWECVKRHFRERGKDIQNEDFTCIGCGDMSGDVFGNGMLLSRHIKLVGAFNHVQIFVDPDPDPATSWAERKRLFDLPRSAWTDYEASLISKGGGVFERKAKSIKTSPEMRKIFGISKAEVTPSELIRAMLKAEVELLWFGGIGTYVKAIGESDLDVGDRANDSLRITSREVGAKVVGEGANLGLTQRGRVEYGLAGGACNSDSIDNSAGVDCSDHEVNIKILLGAIEQAGAMTRKDRDKLLAKMTDEVGELCLRDNYLQGQAITVTHQLGAHLLDRFGRFMRAMEKDGHLDRAIEYLPDDEVILERIKQGIGLTRPEISVLLSYSKNVLYDDLLASSLPDDRFFLTDLSDYFPKPLRKRFAQEIREHRLRREIVTTVVTNDLVNRVGINFVHEVREKTGMAPDEIARAYTVTREIFGMNDLWSAIEALDNKVPALTQSAMLVACGRLIERETVWFLREAGHPLLIEKTINDYADGVRTLTGCWERLLSADDRQTYNERTQAFEAQGVPGTLARRIAILAHLAPVCDVVRLAREAGLSAERVAEVYSKVGDRYGFDWLRRAASSLPTDTAWDKLAVTAIVDDFYGHQSELVAAVLNGQSGDGEVDHLLETWADQRRPQLGRNAQLLQELRSSGTPDLAMLAVANRQIKAIVAG